MNTDAQDRHERPAPRDDPGFSAEVVRRIHAGDRAAFADLYLRYRDRLLLSVRCRLGNALRARLESEDVMQSVFKDAMEDLRHFQPRGPDALERFLHVCVLNKIRQKAEHFATQKRAGDTPLTESMAEGLATAEPLRYADHARYERLEQGLARLPADMREVILLRQVEGLSHAAAAAELGRTPEATAKLYARAIARLGLWVRAQEGA